MSGVSREELSGLNNSGHIAEEIVEVPEENYDAVPRIAQEIIEVPKESEEAVEEKQIAVYVCPAPRS